MNISEQNKKRSESEESMLVNPCAEEMAIPSRPGIFAGIELKEASRGRSGQRICMDIYLRKLK